MREVIVAFTRVSMIILNMVIAGLGNSYTTRTDLKTLVATL